MNGIGQPVKQPWALVIADAAASGQRKGAAMGCHAVSGADLGAMTDFGGQLTELLQLEAKASSAGGRGLPAAGLAGAVPGFRAAAGGSKAALGAGQMAPLPAAPPGKDGLLPRVQPTSSAGRRETKPGEQAACPETSLWPSVPHGAAVAETSNSAASGTEAVGGGAISRALMPVEAPVSGSHRSPARSHASGMRVETLPAISPVGLGPVEAELAGLICASHAMAAAGERQGQAVAGQIETLTGLMPHLGRNSDGGSAPAPGTAVTPLARQFEAQTSKLTLDSVRLAPVEPVAVESPGHFRPARERIFGEDATGPVPWPAPSNPFGLVSLAASFPRLPQQGGSLEAPVPDGGTAKARALAQPDGSDGAAFHQITAFVLDSEAHFPVVMRPLAGQQGGSLDAPAPDGGTAKARALAQPDGSDSAAFRQIKAFVLDSEAHFPVVMRPLAGQQGAGAMPPAVPPPVPARVPGLDPPAGPFPRLPQQSNLQEGVSQSGKGAQAPLPADGGNSAETVKSPGIASVRDIPLSGIASRKELPPAGQIAAFLAGPAGGAQILKKNGQAAPSSGPFELAGGASRPVMPSGVTILRLRLEPEDLGGVTVKMRLAGARLDLQVEAEQPETARLIDKDRDLLAGKLQSAGYAVDALVINSRGQQAEHPRPSPGLILDRQEQSAGQAFEGPRDHGHSPNHGRSRSRPAQAGSTADAAGTGSPGGEFFL